MGQGTRLITFSSATTRRTQLTSGAGDDTYVVGAGDTVVEALNAGIDTVQSPVTWTLGANVENLTLTGTAAINGTGNTLANVLTGKPAITHWQVGTATIRCLVKGNDALNGGTGNDVFQFARGDGQDTITDASGTGDRLSFASGIDPLDLMLSQSANDLRIAVYGSTDQVTIANWYAGASNQVETVQVGNGQQLMSTQVNQLIQAMAGFTQQTGLLGSGHCSAPDKTCSKFLPQTGIEIGPCRPAVRWATSGCPHRSSFPVSLPVQILAFPANCE